MGGIRSWPTTIVTLRNARETLIEPPNPEDTTPPLKTPEHFIQHSRLPLLSTPYTH